MVCRLQSANHVYIIFCSTVEFFYKNDTYTFQTAGKGNGLKIFDIIPGLNLII
jgi:hypothetical protein